MTPATGRATYDAPAMLAAAIQADALDAVVGTLPGASHLRYTTGTCRITDRHGQEFLVRVIANPLTDADA